MAVGAISVPAIDQHRPGPVRRGTRARTPVAGEREETLIARALEQLGVHRHSSVDEAPAPCCSRHDGAQRVCTARLSIDVDGGQDPRNSGGEDPRDDEHKSAGARAPALDLG